LYRSVPDRDGLPHRDEGGAGRADRRWRARRFGGGRGRHWLEGGHCGFGRGNFGQGFVGRLHCINTSCQMFDPDVGQQMRRQFFQTPGLESFGRVGLEMAGQGKIRHQGIGAGLRIAQAVGHRHHFSPDVIGPETVGRADQADHQVVQEMHMARVVPDPSDDRVDLVDQRQHRLDPHRDVQAKPVISDIGAEPGIGGAGRIAFIKRHGLREIQDSLIQGIDAKRLCSGYGRIGKGLLPAVPPRPADGMHRARLQGTERAERCDRMSCNGRPSRLHPRPWPAG